MLSPDVPLLAQNLGKYKISVNNQISEQQHNDHTVNKTEAGSSPGSLINVSPLKQSLLPSPQIPLLSRMEMLVRHEKINTSQKKKEWLDFDSSATFLHTCVVSGRRVATCQSTSTSFCSTSTQCKSEPQDSTSS